jgi:hypothetical protein
MADAVRLIVRMPDWEQYYNLIGLVPLFADLPSIRELYHTTSEYCDLPQPSLLIQYIVTRLHLSDPHISRLSLRLTQGIGERRAMLPEDCKEWFQ